MILVPSIKVSIPIAGADLPRDVFPPLGTPGSATATVELRVKGAPSSSGEAVQLVAVVKARSYRDVLKKVDACPQGAWAVLQGKLEAGGVLAQAGFVVQPAKVEEPAAVESA